MLFFFFLCLVFQIAEKQERNYKLKNIKIMENDMYLMYEAPLVEVIEVEVEKGFANSGRSGGMEGFPENDIPL